jgi:hypothetical protein
MQQSGSNWWTKIFKIIKISSLLSDAGFFSRVDLETAQITCPITTWKKCNINDEGVSTVSTDESINFGIIDQALEVNPAMWVISEHTLINALALDL